MGWRQITKNDIENGVVVWLSGLDGTYNIATIIGVHDHPITDKDNPHFTVARPYAYASADYNTIQPLLGAEVFEIGFSHLEGVKIWKSLSDRTTTMATKAI